MFKKIMVPLDGSELAECVLPYVQTMTEARGVQTGRLHARRRAIQLNAGSG